MYAAVGAFVGPNHPYAMPDCMLDAGRQGSLSASPVHFSYRYLTATQPHRQPDQLKLMFLQCLVHTVCSVLCSNMC